MTAHAPASSRASAIPVAARERAIDVALGDSNPLMLSALAECFDRDRRFSLVATASTAERFLEAVLRVPVRVGIIDWTLPLLGGERLIDVLRHQSAPPRIVVYAQGPGDLPRRAMAAGAAGFCTRSEPPEKLLEIVLEVAKGQMVFPYLDVRDLRSDPIHSLTERERELLAALARGLSNKELSRELDITLNTVKFHLRNLFEKLAINKRAQAIALFYASQTGQAWMDPRAESER